MRCLFIVTAACAVFAAAPLPEELHDANDWVSAKFKGVQAAASAHACVEVHANHDPVQSNGRAGKPLNIAGRVYTRGLYCHAPSRLLVRPGKTARTFEAVVGIDSNDQTSGGRGSVVFSVRAGDAERSSYSITTKATTVPRTVLNR